MLEKVKEKDDNKKTIEDLSKIYDFEALYNDKIYHNTKLLLKLYSNIID